MIDNSNNIASPEIYNFEVFEVNPPEHWNDTILSLGGNIFHSSFWAGYETTIQGGTPVYILAKDSLGKPCAASMAYFYQSNNPFLSLVTRYLELPTHPCVIVKSEYLISDFIYRCENYARKKGCARISIGSNMSENSAFLPEKSQYKEYQRAEFLVDLSAETTVLWGAIKKDQRDRIKKIEKKGLILSEGVTLEDLKGLKVVRESTQKRRTSKNQGYELRKEEEFYSNIYEQLISPGIARLFIAKHDDFVVAAILFSAFNKQAYSIFSGSTDFGYKAGAQSGLYWLAVNTFKDEGYRSLNRGGLPAAAENEEHELHGIYRFKHRLGTTPRLCRSGVKILSPFRNNVCKLKDRVGSFLRGT
ncbi:peptidoglycan bridge formation glycyltransferase FemA/FemB family protein [Beggiatoa alba]|nr:peptidoglycan bridge formation glycyltransferase FemA/FemB family protein [Beggiatoa alba]